MKKGWDQADPHWGRGFPDTQYLQGTPPRTRGGKCQGQGQGRRAAEPLAPPPQGPRALPPPGKARRGQGARPTWLTRAEGLGSTDVPAGSVLAG